MSASAALLAALLVWPLLAACGMQLAAALPLRSGARPIARPDGVASYISVSIQLALAGSLSLVVTVGGQRLALDAGSLVDGTAWGAAWSGAWGGRFLLGLDGLSAPGILLTSGLGLGWYLGRLGVPPGPPERTLSERTPTERTRTDSRSATASETQQIPLSGALLMTTLISGFFLSRDLLLLPSLLFVLEVPLVLWVGLRPSLPRLLSAAAVLFGAIRFAELHGRAFGHWSFDYDRLIRMTFSPGLQRPLFLWITGGICAWALFVLVGIHRRAGEKAEPHSNGPFGSPHHSLIALLPGVVAYGLLRLAIPLFPNAARSFQSEVFGILAAGFTALALFALKSSGSSSGQIGKGARQRIWTYLGLLYSGCAAFLVFSFGAEPWRLALMVSAYFPLAWALYAQLEGQLEALAHPSRLGRTLCIVAPPAVAIAVSYSSLHQAPIGALGLGVVFSAASAAASLGWVLHRSRGGMPDGERTQRPPYGHLFVLLIALAACGLAYRAQPALDALEGYTKERISHPPRGLTLRFELVGRETAPTPALGVDRPIDRRGGSSDR